MIEHTIKRSNIEQEFTCPVCEIGRLQWKGSVNLFRYRCKNKDCGSMFM